MLAFALLCGWCSWICDVFFFFFQAEDGIRDLIVTGVQTCALPILDGSGSVYVTGSSKNSSSHFTCVTIKYSANGSQLWLSRYTGPANSDDEARALALYNAGNVYVAAKSKGNVTDFDYATIKYGNSGTQLWASRY